MFNFRSTPKTAISDATIASLSIKKQPALNAPKPADTSPGIDYSANIKINRAALIDGIQCSLAMSDAGYAAKVLVAHLSGVLLVSEPDIAAQLGELVGINTPATSTEV